MGGILQTPVSSQALHRSGNENFQVACSEMQGCRTTMEDTHTICLNLSNKHPNLGFFGIFDGHAGDKASIYLSEKLHERIGALEDPMDPVAVQTAVLDFDEEFLSFEEHINSDDGSTCIFAVVRPFQNSEGAKQYEVVLAHVGDSRALLVRRDGSIVALTTDHKPEVSHEAERIKRAGGTVQMNRVDGQLAMSRAIGDAQYKLNSDLPREQQKVIALADTTKFTADPEDMLVLYCDGIVEQLSNEEAATCLTRALGAEHGEAVDLCLGLQALFELSLRRGSRDNHSAIIIAFRDGRGYAKDKEFRPGPFHEHKKDQNFVKAYLADARRHGYEGEVLMEAISQIHGPKPSKDPASEQSS